MGRVIWPTMPYRDPDLERPGSAWTIGSPRPADTAVSLRFRLQQGGASSETNIYPRAWGRGCNCEFAACRTTMRGRIS